MSETAVRGSRGGQGAWWPSDLVRWAALSVACAGGSFGLAWLGPVVPLPSPVGGVALLLAWIVLPLAAALVPVLVLRRVPRKQRKVAWQLIFPVVAGVALGVFGMEVGDQAALAERGTWGDAVVVRKDDSGKTDFCDLRTADGREISPALSEGEGCEEWVTAGSKLRVRYDPASVARPTTDEEAGSEAGLLAVLFVLAVGMGTWGGVRQSRWDREHVGVGE